MQLLTAHGAPEVSIHGILSVQAGSDSVSSLDFLNFGNRSLPSKVRQTSMRTTEISLLAPLSILNPA